MKPVLFVDIDGVVADSMVWWIDLYNRDNGTAWKKEQFTEWNTVEQHGVDLYPYFTDYDQVQPVPGAFGSLGRLNKFYRTVFATAGSGSEWLKRFWTDPEIICVQDKSLLRGYALIDDRPLNLDGFQGERFLLRQPWNTNRGLNDVTWQEITEHLMELGHANV